MKQPFLKICLCGFTAFCLAACAGDKKPDSAPTRIDGEQLTYILPPPQTDGKISVERTMAERRSRRTFTDEAVPAAKLSQILWAAYGITKPRPDWPALRGGFRTAPSAGGLYPLEVYAVVGNVDGIEDGVYKYIPSEHKIVRTVEGDLRDELCKISLEQTHVRTAPVTIFYSAVFSRTTQKYGERGRYRYVCMDLGHSAQNVYLQAEALGLGTCAIGSFSDDEVAALLRLPEEERPLYIMPLGNYAE